MRRPLPVTVPPLAAVILLLSGVGPAATAAGTVTPARSSAGPGRAVADSSGAAVPLAPAAAVPYSGGPLRYSPAVRLAAGVVARAFAATGAGGPVAGDLLEVHLRDPHVTVGLLHPAVVAARAPVSAMADAQRAVAGVNGDFFNISETHAGVPPTGSAVGPEVAGGQALKAAVPDGQRFGPALVAGASAEDVIGVDADRRGRVARLHLTGTVRDGRTVIALRGLNQYALPVDGVGAFTAAWGPASRLRAACGTDTARSAPCSDDTAEATVRRGVVAAVTDTIGAGEIPPDTTVLVGREGGADALRALRPGDRVEIGYRLSGPRFRFAVGGLPILRDGAAPAGLDAAALAPRTGAGVSRDGDRLYLVTVDGRSERSGGMTLAELSALLRRLGADDGVNLDGGGSTTFAARLPRQAHPVVLNVPSDGAERAVANGIGVFAR